MMVDLSKIENQLIYYMMVALCRDDKCNEYQSYQEEDVRKGFELMDVIFDEDMCEVISEMDNKSYKICKPIIENVNSINDRVAGANEVCSAYDKFCEKK